MRCNLTKLREVAAYQFDYGDREAWRVIDEAISELECLRAILPPPGTARRVTHHDDGTIEVVGLRGRRPRDSSYAPAWVDDVPAEPEDGAR